MNQADTAWMLVSTALVLLMTPALAFFYGGLVRSKNALNTMMMSFIALGFVGVALGARRLLAGLRRRQRAGSATLSHAFLRGVGLEAQGHASRTCCSWLPGHVRHHHRGADLRRDRRAHAVSGLRRLHHALGARRLRARRALGLGRRLAGEDGRARLRRRHGRARQRRRRGAGRGASSSASARTIRRRRCCRTTCRSRCSAPACSGSAGSASTPAARSRRTASRRSPSRRRCSRRRRRWSSGRCSTSCASGKPTAVGARDGDRRRPRRDHAGGRLRQPDERDRARRASPRSRATSALHLARQDVARRLARRRRRARRRRHGRRAAHRRVRAEGAGTASPTALLFGNPGAARRSRRSRCCAAIVYSGVVSFVLLKLIALVVPLRPTPPTKRPGSTSRSTAKRPTCSRRDRVRGSIARRPRSQGAHRWSARRTRT